MDARSALNAVKWLHTVVWAFFVLCILGAPLAVASGHLVMATVLVGLVTVEALVLLINRWRCPLTDVAARYTTDRAENFDIHLPLWLAKYNKIIFTPLYLLGAAYTMMGWLTAR